MLKLIHASDMQFYSVREYCCSFDDKWNDLNSFAILLSERGIDDYFEWIHTYEKNMYYLVDDENENYIIGYGKFDDTDNSDYHISYLNKGIIGYGIRPNERNKGYGTKLLNLLLEKCQEIGMNRIYVSCFKENTYSKKVILNNHGILEKEFFDDDSGRYALKFMIKLHPKLSVRMKRVMSKNQFKKLD